MKKIIFIIIIVVILLAGTLYLIIQKRGGIEPAEIARSILSEQIVKFPSLVYDGKVIGENYDYVNLYLLFELNEKLGYYATKNGKRFAIYHGEENEISDEYEINFFTEIDGKLTCGRIGHYVYYNGIKHEEGSDIYKQFKTKHEEKESLAQKDKEKYNINRDYIRIFFDNKGYRRIFDSLSDIKEINGKLVFKAEKQDRTQVLVYDGTEIGEYWQIDIDSVKEIDGKLAYVAKRAAQKSVVVYDGEESELYWRVISPIFEINGKLVYFVDYKDHDHMLVVGGEKFDFDGYLCSIVQVGNKLAFTITERDCHLAF